MPGTELDVATFGRDPRPVRPPLVVHADHRRGRGRAHATLSTPPGLTGGRPTSPGPEPIHDRDPRRSGSHGPGLRRPGRSRARSAAAGRHGVRHVRPRDARRGGLPLGRPRGGHRAGGPGPCAVGGSISTPWRRPARRDELLVDGLRDAIRTPLGPLFAGRPLATSTRSDRLDELAFDLRLGGGGAGPPSRDIGRMVVGHLPSDHVLRPVGRGAGRGVDRGASSAATSPGRSTWWPG